MKFERYDARLGSVAFPYNDKWIVVDSDGEEIGAYADESEARSIAAHRNLKVDFWFKIIEGAVLALSLCLGIEAARLL